MKLKAWDILIAILQEPQNHQEREALFSILLSARIVLKTTYLLIQKT